MKNNVISRPKDIPEIIITTGISEKEKYTHSLILSSFSQEINKGYIWHDKGDKYSISFATLPELLLRHMEHGGYQILEIKFIFNHYDIDNDCDIERNIILKNPSVKSILNIAGDGNTVYKWTIYNSWTNNFPERD